MNATPVTTAVTTGVTTAPGQGQAGLPGEVIMRARGLEMSFGQTHALRGVDLDVAAGEVLAVTGPSGSGKSTLLHVMAGVLVPDAGRVDYHGADTTQDIAALDEAARSRLRLKEFGFIFQFGQLLPDLSALDNVTIPLLLAGTPRRRALAQARETLGELGLSEHLDKRPTQLSGGQAQRAAVARALVTNPRLLSLAELYLVGNSFPEGSAERRGVFETAQRLFPDAPVSRFNAIAGNLADGNNGNYTDFLANFPASAEQLNNLGVHYALAGNYQQAAECFRRAGNLPQAVKNLQELSKVER